MHSDPAAVRKSVRLYVTIGVSLLVFTAITVAIIIACIKGSMVASVFMHLTHEKKWIYGALLLTVVFFIFLMCIPLFTIMDSIGTPVRATPIEHAGH